MIQFTYHGHSCVEIAYDNHRLIIDPFLNGNPVATVKPEQIKVEYILLTHGHGDHVGDTVQIAKANDATVISTNELGVYLGWQGVKTHRLSLGGSFTFPFGRVKLTQAFHGSSLEFDDTRQIVYLGMPAGILLTLGDKTIYHAGDTGLFGDMKLIGELNDIDLAFLPIGDNYTMGPEDAVHAARFLNAKEVVPIHYNTFPLIAQDGDAYAAKLAEIGIKGRVAAPGESFTIA